MNPHPALTIENAGAGVAAQVPGIPPGSSLGSDTAHDPEIERMLTAHVHCGEEMTLIVPDDPRETDNDDPDAALARRSGVGTYRCFCGFSFDQGNE